MCVRSSDSLYTVLLPSGDDGDDDDDDVALVRTLPVQMTALGEDRVFKSCNEKERAKWDYTQ